MPVIAESVSLPNLSSIKLLNESITNGFKKNDRDNADNHNHAAHTLRQLFSTNIEYVEVPKFSISSTNLAQSRYVLLKPHQPSPNVSFSTFKRVLKTNDNGNGHPPTSTKTSTPQLPKPKRVLFEKSNIVLGWNSPQVVNWNSGSGLNNIGNTCYLNSALQAFLHVPAIAQWLINDKEHSDRCKDNSCINCNMASTLRQTHRPHTGSFTPSLITSRLNLICKHLTYGRQEDSHEFLRYCIEKMEKSYLTRFRTESWFKDLDQYSKETTPLNQILGGYLRSTVTCLSCNHESVTFQHFQDLQLDISRVSKLGDAIDGYFSRENLEECGYKCESCKKRVSAAKKFSLERAPVVLCIQLKRFTAMGGKISKSISITETVSLQKYLSKTSDLNQKYKYKFVSMVTHLGSSVGGGHYTAVGKAPNKNFYEFDDSRVNYLSLERALKPNAYILFYELEQESQSSLRSPHNVALQNGHTYSKNGSELYSNVLNGTASTSSHSNYNNEIGFSKPTLPKLIPHMLKHQKQQKENSEASKNGGKLPMGNIGNENIVSEKERVAPVIIVKEGISQKRDNEDSQLSMQCKKLKLDNFPSMPKVEKDDDPVASAIINNTSPVKKVSLVPYELDEDEEEKNEAKLLRTASGVFYETEIKKNIKGPSMHGSTIITKASSENQQVKRSEDTVQQLSKLHHNGYGSGNVISWKNEASQMSKEVSNEQKNAYGKRQLDLEDDVDMDRGRLKKIKIHTHSPPRAASNGNGKLPNPFQEQQNMKNGYQDRPSNQHYQHYHNSNHRFNNNNHHNNHNGSNYKNKPYPSWKGQNGSRGPYNNRPNNRSNYHNNNRR